MPRGPRRFWRSAWRFSGPPGVAGLRPTQRRSARFGFSSTIWIRRATILPRHGARTLYSGRARVPISASGHDARVSCSGGTSSLGKCSPQDSSGSRSGRCPCARPWSAIVRPSMSSARILTASTRLSCACARVSCGGSNRAFPRPEAPRRVCFARPACSHVGSRHSARSVSMAAVSPSSRHAVAALETSWTGGTHLTRCMREKIRPQFGNRQRAIYHERSAASS